MLNFFYLMKKIALIVDKKASQKTACVFNHKFLLIPKPKGILICAVLAKIPLTQENVNSQPTNQHFSLSVLD